MGEQEKYKNLLRKVIQETENHKIQTSEEMVKALVHELGNNQLTKLPQQQSFAD
ncbi:MULTISPECIES: hypothetical protein [Virgibacillus]|uniref:Uncharacterized protein n=2 Tax=Virgibacillus TaxID=84406 RepID=A0A024Q955_9BACI|nr:MULTISPECIES: hypothetical protein [Virgibacillus]EQB37493.1 hypothetical protein M948_02810 [Virgibacillus sp. CM-4]GGJ60527.1 hypothetical protein GCM10007111_23280 [Virgibacillus kapii]CDQ38989.1 hypothetical protein BN990_01270 [Virgibacillus massiliensis]